jgi:hypothetical protein
MLKKFPSIETRTNLSLFALNILEHDNSKDNGNFSLSHPTKTIGYPNWSHSKAIIPN